ncbi:NLI interacting factor-like phosphatase [Fusobacterium sp. CM21]|uniref:HAD-IIIC family phosphatase n=1 Tax=Fusobacterium nucleatum TaxID=851 RepID=UPI0003E1F5FB|nr:HAD-IIIC family phosphatase [Fusobacterium nucleatum]ETT12269.1 NLI interacting factor-like phosphatase [Fusobacterium sp. CM21]OHU81695.1 hydrolase [Fusobacterium nucleatum]
MKKIFEYPLDYEYILRKRKSIKKSLLENKSFIEKKIAILGGSTTSEIKNVLELFLLNENIKPIFFESEYNKFYEDALFSKELENFFPEIVYIHTNYHNITFFPSIENTEDEVKDLLEKEYDKFKLIWKSLEEKFNCIVIQNNFDFPKERIMGNYDRISNNGRINFIDSLNRKFIEYAKNNNKFYINDINYLSAQIGLEKWENSLLWYSYKYAISYEAIPRLCKSISNIIKAIYGKNKKCIVLDLDNTLWGGVIGDDGLNGIKIGTETAIGEAYTGFQKYIKDIKKLGITLAIASKNEEEIAKEGLNLKEMILRENDFFSIKANWNPKTENIKDIANEINIGLDSIIFLDDNPVEREIVRKQLPEVEVPEIGNDVLKYINYIDQNGFFEIVSFSKEDLERTKYYEDNKEREKAKSYFKDYDEFLKSLEMKAEINFAKPIYFDRITQLINKTNQFNLTTKRYTLAEVENIASSKDRMLIYGRLKDKFGDNGLITIIIGSIKNNEFHIDLWLMSCRVLKREMENAMLDFLVEYCKKNSIKKIYGYYYKTPKNNMVKDFYKEMGFKNLLLNNEKSEWVLEVDEISDIKNKVIEIGEY